MEGRLNLGVFLSPPRRGGTRRSQIGRQALIARSAAVDAGGSPSHRWSGDCAPRLPEQVPSRHGPSPVETWSKFRRDLEQVPSGLGASFIGTWSKSRRDLEQVSSGLGASPVGTWSGDRRLQVGTAGVGRPRMGRECTNRVALHSWIREDSRTAWLHRDRGRTRQAVGRPSALRPLSLCGASHYPIVDIEKRSEFMSSSPSDSFIALLTPQDACPLA